MELIQAFKKHIKEICRYQGNNDFYREIESFILQNKELSDSDLLEKVYSRYGTRIKFFEEATRHKQIESIKSWVSLCGFIFVIGVAIGVIYFFDVISR